MIGLRLRATVWGLIGVMLLRMFAAVLKAGRVVTEHGLR